MLKRIERNGSLFRFLRVIKTDRYIPLFIFLGGLFLFIPFLGSVHLFDWDEINFAECAREMIVTHNYNTVQIDFLPFWEKPPLFIWMQVACMKIFGINEFAARLPNAIGGAIILATLFILGKRISGKKFAWYWVIFYAGSLLPQFYFRSGVIDPWFNFFILLSVYHFILYTNEYTPNATFRLWDKRIIYSGLFISLAVLTKGPAAIIIFGLCFIAARILKRKPLMAWKHFGVYILIAAVPAGAWFLSLVVQGKGGVIIDFIQYQVRLFTTEDAGHGHNFFYHWLVLLFGCFPVSAFAMQGMWNNGNSIPFEKHALNWMRILFWVVLILFSIVKTKIIHYSSLCYFPLTYIGAHAAMQLETGGLKPQKWVITALMVTGSAICIALFAVPWFDQLVPWMIQRQWIKDPFAEASFSVGANWQGWEWLIGVLLFALLCCAAWLYQKSRTEKSVYLIAIGTMVSVALACIVIVPKVEGYTQRAAIEFWQSKSTEKCFVQTLGYKSYAQFFYGNTQPLDASSAALFDDYLHQLESTGLKRDSLGPEDLRYFKQEWLAHGTIDRPVYFVSKNTYVDEARQYYPDIEQTGEKNGFVFWIRKPSTR